MKVKVLDLATANDEVEEMYEKDTFEYQGYSWTNYLKKLNRGNLDGVELSKDEVDTKVFILDDGGELIRLKDGTYLNVCWRGDSCRVWEEDDEDLISYFEDKLYGNE